MKVLSVIALVLFTTTSFAAETAAPVPAANQAAAPTSQAAAPTKAKAEKKHASKKKAKKAKKAM